MSDIQFDTFVKRVEQEEIYLSIIVPNGGSVLLDTARSIKVGESLGIEFFQRLLLTDPGSGEVSLTPHKYLVVDLVVRRQNQHLIKKMSVPDTNKVIDHITGQVTGDSKGSTVSLPELLVMDSKDLTNNLLEMIKVRGGDDVAYRGMLDSIKQTGTFSLEPLMELGSKPTSTEVLRALLFSIHYETTMGK